MTDLLARLWAYRLEHGLSYRRLAAKLQSSEAALYSWRRGARQPGELKQYAIEQLLATKREETIGEHGRTTKHTYPA